MMFMTLTFMERKPEKQQLHSSRTDSSRKQREREDGETASRREKAQAKGDGRCVSTGFPRPAGPPAFDDADAAAGPLSAPPQNVLFPFKFCLIVHFSHADHLHKCRFLARDPLLLTQVHKVGYQVLNCCYCIVTAPVQPCAPGKYPQRFRCNCRPVCIAPDKRRSFCFCLHRGDLLNDVHPHRLAFVVYIRVYCCALC